jgi:AraC-like DNA-binding protein
MSSRRIDSPEHAAQTFWRPLAQRVGYDLQAAAQLLEVSVRQLERRCQRDLGCTPREWFQRERMTAASRLLATGHSVKVVAAQLGYTQPANFSRAFKRHHGRTPRALVPRAQFFLPPDSLPRA